MSDLTFVPDEQVALALGRVHARLRRRRNRLRGAGLSALAFVVVLGAGVVNQGRGPEPEAPMGMVGLDAAAAPTESSTSTTGARCGQALGSAEELGLDLTIRGSVQWEAPSILPGATSQVSVVARNVGTSALTVTFPAAVVGLADDALVATESGTPTALPTTLTLEPSEVVEAPASLPSQSCTGDALDSGLYTLVPVVELEIGGRSPLAVRGVPLAVRHG